jgi:uncharacterized membrane protein YdjX (TVP38/TMEM64 family)
VSELPSAPDGDATARTTSTGIDTRRLLRKAVVLLGIVVAGTVAYRFTPLKEWFEPAGQAAAWVRDTGVRGILAFYALSATLIFLGVPRLVFCPVAGAVYGFWGGLALSLVAPATSYYLTFLTLRGRNDGPIPGLPRSLAFLSRDPGVSGVILARLLPLPGMLITLALSLSGVGRRKYLLGTLIGMIPEAAPLVLLGSGLLNPGPNRHIHFGAMALLLVAVVWFAIRGVRRRQRAHRRNLERGHAPSPPLPHQTPPAG